MKFTSLEDSLPAIKTKSGLVNFLGHHPELRDEFFGRRAYPNDSVFINTLFRRFSNPAMDTLLADVHSVFGDGAELREQFRYAFATLKYYYPDFKEPVIETVVSGMESDLLVSDSTIIVGLDYFLGSASKYKPNMYDYMLRRYRKGFIVPSVMLLYGIDSKYNKTDASDKSVLADMISYGKAYYFAKHMLPCVADSVFIGFTSDEITSAAENENLIYARLIDNEVIYSTSHDIKQRYLGERPKTLEIGERCPGRIGQWVGWKIVDSYAEHNPGKSLPQLMTSRQSTAFFRDSHYRPTGK